MKTVYIQQAERFNQSVDTANSMFFMIKFGTSMTKESFIETELIETKILDRIFLMIRYFTVVMLMTDLLGVTSLVHLNVFLEMLEEHVNYLRLLYL